MRQEYIDPKISKSKLDEMHNWLRQYDEYKATEYSLLQNQETTMEEEVLTPRSNLA